LQLQGNFGFIKQPTVSSNETEGTDVLPGVVKSWLPQSCLPKHKTMSQAMLLTSVAGRLHMYSGGESPLITQEDSFKHVITKKKRPKKNKFENSFAWLNLPLLIDCLHADEGKFFYSVSDERLQ